MGWEGQKINRYVGILWQIVVQGGVLGVNKLK